MGVLPWSSGTFHKIKKIFSYKWSQQKPYAVHRRCMITANSTSWNVEMTVSEWSCIIILVSSRNIQFRTYNCNNASYFFAYEISAVNKTKNKPNTGGHKLKQNCWAIMLSTETQETLLCKKNEITDSVHSKRNWLCHSVTFSPFVKALG